jgi:hypothetical protein
VRRVAVTVLVLALLGGTAVAFAMTEALKLERSPIAAPDFDEAFSPTCGCETATATLSFRLRRADRLDLVIVSGDNEVRMLAGDLDRPKGRVTTTWDGRDDSGAIVPDGNYRLRVHLDDARRTIVIPNDIRIDTQPPEVTIVSAGPSVFSPDGDGRRDEIEVHYEANEEGRPVVLVDGVPTHEGRPRREGERTLVWGGRPEGRPFREGTYEVSLQVRDRAGNASRPSDAFSIRIRYVDVVPEAFVVRRGALLRFRVATDAATVSWRLRKPRARVMLASGTARSRLVAVRLPGGVKAGRYLLEVVANGHRDRAVVHVRARRP